MRKVKGALTYPVVVFTLMIGVIFIMMTKVVPKLSSLFTQAGSELPALTRGLMASSSFMSNNWLLILLTTFVIVASFTMWKKTKLGRYNWDKAKLRIPIFGNLMRQYILARFSRLFSSLLGSGVPLVNGMQIIARAIGNEVYKERILLSVEDLKQGIPLAENLTGSSHFPEMMVHMIEVGEKTASLEQVTDKLADFYEEQIDVSVKSLTKAFEPIMLITIGGVVGLLVAAIMLPIIQLTEIGAGGM